MPLFQKPKHLQTKALLAFTTLLFFQSDAWARKHHGPRIPITWDDRVHWVQSILPNLLIFTGIVGLIFGVMWAAKEISFRPIVIFPMGCLTIILLLATLYITNTLNWWDFLLCCGLIYVLPGAYYLLWEILFPRKRNTSHGSAFWATDKFAIDKGRIQPKGFVLSDSHGFVLGRMQGVSKKYDNRLRFTGHVLTCAPTGAGKGIGAVIPNLLEYPGSALVLDIKGENYAVTHRFREKTLGHSVFLLDPFQVTGQTGHGFNWLDRLHPQDPDVVSESAILADMLVIPDNQGDTYWDDAARDLIRGVLIHVASLDDDHRHMGEVRHLLTGGEELLTATLVKMTSSEAGFGVVARSAHAFLSKADKDRSGVLSSAIRHTAFLDDPRIIECLKRSDFRLSDLKATAMTLYVVMPPAKLSAYNRFMRGLVGLTLAAITENQQKPEHNVVLFLDEFAQLGRMTAIEDAISLVRGYGASLWIFVQDLSQLKGVYPKWQTFLANTAQQFFGTADLETAKYISGMLGSTTTTFATSGRNMHDTHLTGGTSNNLHYTGRPLLTPDEVIRLGPTLPLVLIGGEPPYCLQRLNYLNDPEYKSLAENNPFHI